MRDLIFGVEVVLPNGDIINNIHFLHKANRGLDIKSLFSSSEGTHGIITSASLKLFPKPKTVITFMVSCEKPEKSIEFLSFLRQNFSDHLSECELIPKIGFEYITKYKPDIKMPFDAIPKWACLVELSSPFPESIIHDYVFDALETALKQKLVSDVVVARNESQKSNLSHIRMLLSECQKYEGASIKHDVSVPIRFIPELISKGSEYVMSLVPNIRPFPFGHIGDGNIHFNFSQPIDMSKDKFMSFEDQINKIIFDLVHQFGGSFSAEHGIGQLRREQLRFYTTPEENRLRHCLKNAIDPQKIMNFGKVI